MNPLVIPSEVAMEPTPYSEHRLLKGRSQVWTLPSRQADARKASPTMEWW